MFQCNFHTFNNHLLAIGWLGLTPLSDVDRWWVGLLLFFWHQLSSQILSTNNIIVYCILFTECPCQRWTCKTHAFRQVITCQDQIMGTRLPALLSPRLGILAWITHISCLSWNELCVNVTRNWNFTFTSHPVIASPFKMIDLKMQKSGSYPVIRTIDRSIPMQERRRYKVDRRAGKSRDGQHRLQHVRTLDHIFV